MLNTTALRELISQARMESALKGILNVTSGTRFAPIASAINSSYNKYRLEIMNGLLNKNEDNKIYNGITNRLLILLNEFDSDQFSKVDQENIPASIEIYISYAWGGESEEITNRIEKEFKDAGINIIRDKKNLAYKGSIRSFMEKLGHSNGVIVIISDKYLKSKNCLFELLQISAHGSFISRTFPIILQDAAIFDSMGLVAYVEYWEQKISELELAIKRVSPANLHGIREDIDLYTEIRAFLPRLADILRNMNTLTPEMHKESNFAALSEEIKTVLSKKS